jgi:eukaryotic-like serine/threonine-protein kinase
MNPERWRQTEQLFDAASYIPPAERDQWLRNACGDDDQLRADVEYLLDQETRADKDGFLTQPEVANPRISATAEWPQKNRQGSAQGSDVHRQPSMGPDDESGGFSPKAGIARSWGSGTADEARSVIQARLRELPLIYVLVFGVMLFLRPVVLGLSQSSITVPFSFVAAGLVGLTVLLSVRRFSLAQLRWIELGMTGAIASLLVLHEVRTLIGRTLLEDHMFVQFIMKNVVLLTSVLMLTNGIYVPKSWRRAAIVAGLLATLPLASLLGAYLLHPEAVRWVGELRSDGRIPLAVFGLDAVFLFTLAGISAFAAHTISRLRLEVVEARQFGQYRLGRLIGSGGMGDVYLAEHQLLKRSCAVKLIRPGVINNAGTIERFEREVRINAKLSHPNTVEIFDYGRTEDGTYYYVMEYLPGMSLTELVERHGPLPPERAVYLLRQVALALQEAHEAGLIHRDIKPSNIFAARRGGMDDVAKLLDFGLVKPAVRNASPHSSDVGQILGTPHYMSPEQATGSPMLDASSDIYSLGAVAYFLLTGHPPFEERTAIEAIIAHARDPVVPPSQRRAGLPADLESIVLRCLAKDASERFPDAQSLELALGNCDCAAAWDKVRARQWWRGISTKAHENGVIRELFL